MEGPEKIYTSEWSEYPKIKKKGRAAGGYGAFEGFLSEVIEPDKVKEDDDPDYHTVSFCIDRMKEDADEARDGKPFFLACGLVKPVSD